MIAWFLVGICLLLATVAGHFLLVNRKTETELKERKQAHQAAQTRIEELLQKGNEREILMERGAQALELAKNKINELVLVNGTKDEKISGLESTIAFQEEQYKKLLGQKKSSEVRTGKITEQISPFLRDYPLDPATARFIGDPIDFVHFDENQVTFVEVKSGKSQLSKKQREIRDLIREGKVEFLIYRVEGE